MVNDVLAVSSFTVPQGFLWGTAISEYQVSGAHHCPYSNWALWERETHPNGKPRILNGAASENACDFKSLYHQYIPIMQELRTNAFRFSIEWSNIEPQEGNFSEAELQHYEDLIDRLLVAGVTPMITLHHFTDPVWFCQKGGFEREENIFYFVRFCKKVFERLSEKAQLWATFNEPNIYMFQGYLRGVFPPGKMNPLKAIEVMANLLKAHEQTYFELKNMENGAQSQIGFVHQYLKFYPYSKLNPLERIPGFAYNYLLNEAVLNFFKTGSFIIKVPFLFSYEYHANQQEKMIDFIGLNYYSRVLIKAQMNFKKFLVPAAYPHEIMTDMPYAIYPEGIYQAIHELSTLDVPLYITENGISDAKDDRREHFIDTYLMHVGKALSSGYDIRGFFYWSLMDNFEWDEGYTQKFGLCHVDFETKKIMIRNSARRYSAIIRNSKKGL